MSVLSSIMDALFNHPAATQMVPATDPTVAPPATAPGAAPGAVGQRVDVEALLNHVSADQGKPDLNWQASIADLMKLLGIDSSLANREQLATELGYGGEKNGSADMNIWLHKATMEKLAENGGRPPATLLA